MNADGQEGLQMLVEDMNSQLIKTVTYQLKDVVVDEEIK